MKLLLDELYSKQIAEKLRTLGHDVVSIKERPDLEGLKDAELFPLIQTEQRAILTENWADYARLMQEASDQNSTHHGVVFTSSQQLPRSRNTIGLYVRVLDDFLNRHPTADALLNSARWLPDQPL